VKLAKSATREAGMKTEDPAQFLGFIDPPLVFRAAEAGDPIAQVVLRDAAYYGGVALAGIANAYDPELITVGGGIAIHQPQLVEAMRQEMVHHLNVRPPSVRVTRLGAHAVEMGAIALAGQVVAG
jgi:glucokinase